MLSSKYIITKNAQLSTIKTISECLVLILYNGPLTLFHIMLVKCSCALTKHLQHDFLSFYYLINRRPTLNMEVITFIRW